VLTGLSAPHRVSCNHVPWYCQFSCADQQLCSAESPVPQSLHAPPISSSGSNTARTVLTCNALAQLGGTFVATLAVNSAASPTQQ
jgi:hypothetical protein